METPYRPPRSYWKEVRQLDQQIYEQATPWKDAAPFRGRILMGRAALWQGESPMHRTSWQQINNIRRFMPQAAATHNLTMMEAVASELTPNEATFSDMRFLYGTVRQHYTYNTLGRVARVGLSSWTAEEERSGRLAIDPSLIRDDVIEEEKDLSEEQYEILLGELRRGASGEHMIPLTDDGEVQN